MNTPDLTDRQVGLLVAMRAADLSSGNKRRSWTSQDLMDRGALGPVNIIGTTLKRLVDTGMVELTQAPRSRGNRKARYRLTEKGLNKARRFS